MNAGRIDIDGMLFPLQKFAMVTSKSVIKNIVTVIIVATVRSFQNVSAILFTFFYQQIPSHHGFILVAVTVVTDSYRGKFLYGSNLCLRF